MKDSEDKKEEAPVEAAEAAEETPAEEEAPVEAAEAAEETPAEEEAPVEAAEVEKKSEAKVKIRVKGLIGKKLGMTQLFDEEGRAVPATVIQAGPCVVVQKKVPEREGYSVVQLGLVEIGRKIQANQPMKGHFKKAEAPPLRVLKEFPFSETEESTISVGDQVLVENVFKATDLVSVTGKVKGRGFQGVMKRHGFHGGRATHGSMFHRAPGSIGASAYPSRVFKGTKLPGRMGNNQVTIRNLEVVQVEEENNLLVVKGSIPGSIGGYVYINHVNAV